MPIKDNKSGSEHFVMLIDTVTSPNTSIFEGGSTDTANFDNGFTLNAVIVVGDTVDFKLLEITQNTVDNVNTATPVLPNQIIGSLSNLDRTFGSQPNVSLGTLGLIGTDRFIFLKASLEAIDITSTVLIYAVAGVELSPGDN